MSQTFDKPAVEIIHPQQFITNRRGENRTVCLVKGALYFTKTSQAYGCDIVDQSASGAKVALTSAHKSAQGDIWLIDLENHIAKLGVSMWLTPTSMGLKFRFVQSLKPNMPRPPKVPQAVFDLWLSYTNPKSAQPEEPEDDEFFLD